MTRYSKDDQISRAQAHRAIIKKHGLDDSWEISDTEFDNLQKTSAEAGRSISDLIDIYSHIDSKTGMLVTEGWICFGAGYFFQTRLTRSKKPKNMDSKA